MDKEMTIEGNLLDAKNREYLWSLWVDYYNSEKEPDNTELQKLRPTTEKIINEIISCKLILEDGCVLLKTLIADLKLKNLRNPNREIPIFDE